jgi:polyhydroxyalkanoate synthesis regulator phasin
MRGLMVKRGKLNPGSKLNKPYIENLMNKKFAAEPHEMKQEEMIEKMIPRDTVKRKTMAAFIQSKLKSNDNTRLICSPR